MLLLLLLVLGFALRRQLAAIPHGRAHSRIAERRFDDAVWWLGWSAALAPDHPRTEFLRARIARHQGDMARVRDHLERAAELGHPQEAVQREQWLALAQTGQMELAEPHLLEMLTDDRGDGREICEAYLVGFVVANRRDRARDMIRTWTEAYPHDPRPYILAGALEEDADAWDKAIEQYAEALKRHPENPEALLATGKCLLEKKDPEAALQYYERAEKAGARSVTALVGQGRCLRELRQGAEARARVASAAQSAAPPVAATLLLAQLDIDEGKYPQAADRLASVIASDPRNLEARYLYGVALRGAGRPEEALEHMNRAALGNRLLGHAADLKKKLSLSIDDKFQIGSAHIVYGDAAEGVYWLLQVVGQQPDHPQAHLALAEYYEQNKHMHSEYEQLAERHRKLSEGAK